MSDSGLEREPRYSNKMSAIHRTIFFVCVALGFFGLFVLIPVVLLFIFMLIDADSILTYGFSIAVLTLFPLLVIWASFLLYRETRNKLIANKFPSGYDLTDKGLTYRKFDMKLKRYDVLDIPFSSMVKCVVSEKGVPILGQRGRNSFRIVGYYSVPVAHVIYLEKGKRLHLSIELLDDLTADQLLTTLQQYEIPLEITAYDLSSVPDEMLIRALENDISTKSLPYEGQIKEFIDRGQMVNHPPQEYTKAYKEWLVEKRGVISKTYALWHPFVLLGLIFAPVVLGINFFDETVFFIMVVVPYIALVISYMAFIYRLKRAKYWKTLVHAGIPAAIFLGIWIMLGDSASEFFRNESVEAVLGTLAGFYAGSIAPYVLAKDYLRKRWPAQFHEEIAEVITRETPHSY